jgi:sterol desaturase/sphingolipid hydroxylase (fatty acid hydroxylase superfamily)
MQEAVMTLLDAMETIGMMLGAALFLFLPFELWQRRRKGTLNWRSIREMAASVSPLLPTLALSGGVTAFVTALFTGAYSFALFEIPITPLSAIACVALIDFFYYWDHRCGHRVRLYWAISHSVHHSSNQYDQTTGLRISAVDGFLSPWFYTPALLIGFHPLLVVASFGLILAYQQWIHTETIGKLGWFDRVFNSPSNHRVHHGSQPQYLDKNYGAILIIWDRIFGTYEPEGEPVVFGLTEPLGTSNPVAVHFSEAIKLVKDMVAARSWRVLLKMLLLPPGAVIG